MYLITSGSKKSSMLDENSTWSPSQQQQTVPLSPSKRRQSTCHYEDLQASPSKRQSTMASKPPKHALPSSECKMLFGESTNHANTGLEDATPMDVSLVDLSMHDIQPDVEKPHINPAPTTRKASTIKTRSKTKAGPTTKRRRHKNALLQLS